MRIAQIAPLYESVPPKLYGGTERVVHNLTRGLSALGHDVTTFCSGDSTTLGAIEAVWPEALRLRARKSDDPVAYQMRMLAWVARKAGEFDILHNHYDYPMLALQEMTDVPLLTTAHNRMDIPMDMAAAYEMYPHAPLISISDSQRAPAPALNWMATIHHGLDLNSFDFEPRPGKYLAFLGRFSRDKQPDMAIRIARKSGVPLKIAAKIDPSDRDYYDTIVKPEIDGKFIEYVGEISESEKSLFLGDALALVFPIDWPEPFGLVMIEAMACGTPVLARPMGSVPEIMKDGVTGFVRADADELAGLVEKTAVLDRTAIREYAEEHFSIERMTREYLNAYGRLNSERYEPSHARRVAGDRRNFLYSVNGSSHRNR